VGELKIVKVNQSAYLRKTPNGVCAELFVELSGTGKGEILITSQGKEYRTPFSCKEEQKVICHMPEPTEPEVVQGIVVAENEKIEFSAEIKPVRRYDVCFVPTTHHDLGYTDTIDEVKDLYFQYYKDILDHCDYTDAYPEEAKYRYTIETAWSLMHFLDNCSEEDRNRFVRRAREGRIEVSAFFVQIAESICTGEEFIRLMYPSFALKRKYGIPIETAALTDMPGLSWGLPKVLNGVGINRIFAGFPTYFEWGSATTIPGHLFWKEEEIVSGRPDVFRYQGQDGSEISAYYQGSYGFLYYDDYHLPRYYEEIRDKLQDVLQERTAKNTRFNTLRFIVNGTDNYPPLRNICNFVKRWNEEYASPKLTISTQKMFFDKLYSEPVDFTECKCICGELNHTDYPTAFMTRSYELTVNTETKAQLPALEELSVLAELYAGFKQDEKVMGNLYNDVLLYDEHCYGMNVPFGKQYEYDWNLKSSYALKAASKVQKMMTKANRALFEKLAGEAGEDVISVFNPLSFEREDVVTVTNYPFTDGKYEAVDRETGEAVPIQLRFLDTDKLAVPFAAHRHSLRTTYHRNFSYEGYFMAKNVPACGYRTYAVRKVEECAVQNVSSDQWNGVLENEFYKIVFDEKLGAPSSIFDKELQKELLCENPDQPFGSVFSRQSKTGELYLDTVKDMKKICDGDVSETVLITAVGADVPEIVKEFTLYKGVKKIGYSVRILKTSTPTREIYTCFPFDVEDPKFYYEGSNCLPQAFYDVVPGAQSNQITVQSVAKVQGDDIQIAVSPINSHIMEFGGLWPVAVSQAHHGQHPDDFKRPFITKEDEKNGYMYSMLSYNNTITNFSVTQSGEILFSYAFTSGKPGDDMLSFGAASRQKLVPYITKLDGYGTMPPTLNFCSVDAESVRITTVKKAEDGKGIIVRLEETAGKDCSGVLTVNLNNISRVYSTNLAEENRDLIFKGKGIISFDIKAYGLLTFRVEYGDIDRATFLRDRYNQPRVLGHM